MSNEYLSHKGNDYYIIDLDTDEGYSFSEYGRVIERVNAKYVASICRVLNPVDVLSILSDVNSNMCEIYFKGKRAIVNLKGMSVYSRLPRDLPKETFIVFRILRDDCIGLTQLLIPFKKGLVTNDMLSSIFGGLKWN